VTWAKDLPPQSVYFLVAGPWTPEVDVEYEQYHDLIWLNKTDEYRGLSYKTGAFVSIMQTYASRYYTHLFKTDDDSYVNVAELLHTLTHQKVDYWGFSHRKGRAIRPGLPGKRARSFKHAAFAVGSGVYPEAYYPPYCSGAGYALSSRFAECAAQEMSTIRFHPFEDVFMGLMAERCGFTPTGDERVRIEKSSFLSRANTMADFVVQHRVTTRENMMDLHNRTVQTRVQR
jgi:hypothetical protein